MTEYLLELWLKTHWFPSKTAKKSCGGEGVVSCRGNAQAEFPSLINMSCEGLGLIFNDNKTQK